MPIGSTTAAVFVRRRLERDRQGDGVVVKNFRGAFSGHKTPRTLLTRLGRLSISCPIVPHVERFQPWRTAVIRRKGWPLPEMRTQPGERQLARLRIKRDRQALQRSRRHIVGPLVWSLRLIERQCPFPLPIHDRWIVRLGLLELDPPSYQAIPAEAACTPPNP